MFLITWKFELEETVFMLLLGAWKENVNLGYTHMSEKMSEKMLTGS